jgi:isopenicillin N synthase-like dioxygenase
MALVKEARGSSFSPDINAFSQRLPSMLPHLLAAIAFAIRQDKNMFDRKTQCFGNIRQNHID